MVNFLFRNFKESVGNENGGGNPKICIIGAGFSGLCAAIQLKKKLGIDSFTIFETNGDVGGTWLVNTYPGCASDIFSHLYSLSFEQNSSSIGHQVDQKWLNYYEWSENYPSRDEIFCYIKTIVKKYDLVEKIEFNTLVKNLKWMEKCHKWEATVSRNGVTRALYFDFVVNGSGFLRIPYIPPQFLSFKGQILHTAEWDRNVVLEGKTVAVVGSGSSAVQVIPEVAKIAKSVHVYQRSPAWVSPRPQFKFSNFTKSLFGVFPFLMWFLRCFHYFLHELFFLQNKPQSLLHRFGSTACLLFLKRHSKTKEQYKELRPNYTYACKRVCMSESYYPTFKLPSVKLHREEIIRVADDFIETKEGIEKIDVNKKILLTDKSFLSHIITKTVLLILATGFKTHEYFTPMEIIGKNKENILETWKKDSPSLLYGVIGSSTPNLFTLLGPNTILTNNSVLFILECQVNYMIKVIEKMIESNYKSVCVKSEVEKTYMNQLKTRMKEMIWTKECNSWYKKDNGDVTMLWPWSTLRYWWNTRNVNFDQLHFE